MRNCIICIYEAKREAADSSNSVKSIRYVSRESDDGLLRHENYFGGPQEVNTILASQTETTEVIGSKNIFHSDTLKLGKKWFRVLCRLLDEYLPQL